MVAAEKRLQNMNDQILPPNQTFNTSAQDRRVLVNETLDRTPISPAPTFPGFRESIEP
jgi:hypothetical protein